jgi:nucleolar protein 4
MAEPNKKRRLSQEDISQVSDTKMETTTTKASEAPASKQPNKTLFVRSLPVSATTEKLAEFFSESYVIKHATVVVNPETKVSKGFGFVTFADLEDAQSALEELNNADFDGKKIRVEYAQPRHREIDEKLGRSVPAAAAIKNKQEREDQRTQNQPPRLIIRNLPWSIETPEQLSRLFLSFGKVKHAVLPKKGNKLQGFGFIVLRGKKNAEKALQSINGKEVDGRQLAVDWAVEKEAWDKANGANQEEEKEEEEEGEKEDVDMEVKEDLEEAAGEEASSDADEDDDMEDLDEDLDDNDEDEDDEEEKEDDRTECTIFLRNLPFTCTDESLYEHFTQFGPLRYARIVVDHETERPRGTGFVCFWKLDDAITCIRGAPKTNEMPADKERSKPAMKHSVLQNEDADPSGKYTMEGRVLQVARAVNKREATRLNEEGVSRRLVRDKDKRRLYLLSEGTIASNSPMYKKLSPSEIKMREASFKQRETFIKKNPALHLSLTRLSIRNIPRHITSKDLKQLARQAVVGFATDVSNGIREPLSKEEKSRSSEEMEEMENLRKTKKQGIVRQAMIVYETREGTKVPEKGGGGRSRGYGFIEYFTHRHALMGLRWLNGHPIDVPVNNEEEDKDRKKRLVVEFAIDNAQVIKRRKDLEEKKRLDKEKNDQEKEQEVEEETDQKGMKRKRGGKGKEGEEEGAEDDEEENKIAKRNRIIAQKRMKRKHRKGKA